MSLRFFHVVFITLSTLLALGLAGWEYGNYRTFGGGYLMGTVLSLIVAAGLISYGFWFWKKAKRLIL